MTLTKYFKKGIIGLVILGLIYLLSLGIIYVISPDPPNKFPQNCPNTPNCTRVAEINVRGDGLKPLLINTSINYVHSSLIEWIKNQPRGTVLFSNDTFIHAKFLSSFFRFADDLYIYLFCNNSRSSFWVQSQSRLGNSDLRVNENRVQNLFKFISGYKYPKLNCTVI